MPAKGTLDCCRRAVSRTQPPPSCGRVGHYEGVLEAPHPAAPRRHRPVAELTTQPRSPPCWIASRSKRTWVRTRSRSWRSPYYGARLALAREPRRWMGQPASPGQAACGASKPSETGTHNAALSDDETQGRCGSACGRSRASAPTVRSSGCMLLTGARTNRGGRAAPHRDRGSTTRPALPSGGFPGSSVEEQARGHAGRCPRLRSPSSTMRRSSRTASIVFTLDGIRPMNDEPPDPMRDLLDAIARRGMTCGSARSAARVTAALLSRLPRAVRDHRAPCSGT